MAEAGGGFVFTVGVERDGVLVHRAPVSLVVCLEDAVFRAVIAGRIPNDGKTPPYRFTPVWNGEDPPTVAAVELHVQGLEVTRYATDVVVPQVRAQLRRLVKDGVLASTDEVRWKLFADEAVPEPAARRSFSARVSRVPLPLERGSLPDSATGEFTVEFDARVLEGLSAEVAAGDAVERAWLLVGSLVHDRNRAAAQLRVRGAAPVEAGRGGASQHHFAFDPAAFVAAQRAALSTATGVIRAGWGHSHPPCVECRDTAGCLVDTRFFSADDVEVHSSAFTSPFAVGLVVGKVGNRPANQLGFRLYGWERAQVRERSYRVFAA